MKRIKLFCFPCAGGSSQVYQKWKNDLDDSIQLQNVELSGRGMRFEENLYGNLEEMVDDVYNQIRNSIDGSQYAFFGHSLGCILAYELIYKIKENGGDEPIHMFVAGEAAPTAKKKEHIIHNLPPDEFRKEILQLGGIPKEIAENDQILDFFLPIILSDYKVAETYQWKDKKEVLNCDISILYGEEDLIGKDELLMWQKLTSGKSSVHEFTGGHFFIDNHTKEIIDIINNKLKR